MSEYSMPILEPSSTKRPSADALLDVRDMVGGYRSDLDILHGVSLRVFEGQMVSIIGPNGAGKSTILRAIFGSLKLRGGSVKFDGEDVTGRSPRERLERGITFVPQGHNIFPEMSVEDNLQLGSYTVRDKRRVAEDIARVYEQFPMLVGIRKSAAGYLSGGQMQILEMGRALLLRPRLILIDEPSLGLSPKMAKEIFHMIAEMKSQDVSILIVEQNAEASLRMSDHAYVVATGNSVMNGTAERIRTDDSVRRLYLGA